MRGRGARALGSLLIAAAACRRGGSVEPRDGAGADAPFGIDAPRDGAADAPVDAGPAHCTPRPGTAVAAPVWATIDGEPVLVTAPVGDPRVFVVDRLGTIWILDRDGGAPRRFLDASARVEHVGLERGLLGLAFPPDYAQSGRFYVDYTRASAAPDEVGDIVVAEYRVSAADPDAADPASGREVLVVEHSRLDNHNGGMIELGPDGLLYVAVGDGGARGTDVASPNAQDPAVLLGKLLRIDPRPGPSAPYRVPADNPFVSTAGARPEIWHLGLRNPWRFSFDAATGALLIADVGAGQEEEIDLQPPGRGGLNWGWDQAEGNNLAVCRRNGCDSSAFVAPIATHTHRDGWCSIIGGAVYRGACFPDLRGRYFYADYCRTDLWSFVVPEGAGTVTPAVAATDLSRNLTSLHADGLGELYVTDQDGEIRRLEAAAP